MCQATAIEYMCSSLVLIAGTVFHFECRQRHTHTHTHRDATDHLTHTLTMAGMGNKVTYYND